MEPLTESTIWQVIQQFNLDGKVLSIRPVSAGHINDTFTSQVQTAEGLRAFVHQRINHTVFRKPEEVMENIARVTEHARREIEAAGGDPVRQTLRLVPALDGGLYCRAPGGDFWRTYYAIPGAHTCEIPENPGQVYQAARAFGQFQMWLSRLPGARLHETIPDFHNTPKRFAAFQQAVEADPCNRAAGVKSEVDFILAREADTRLAVNRLASGELPERVTHNDTKLNNVMLDDRSGEGICVLDLDTVMPGTILYDFGDMVRAGAVTAAEDEPDLSKVRLDLDLFRWLAAGYTETARDFLTPLEWELLPQAGKLITLEQGMRFLSDYLQGDRYYRTHRPGQNLDRARTQLKLVAEMEWHLDELRAVVEACRAKDSLPQRHSTQGAPETHHGLHNG